MILKECEVRFNESEHTYDLNGVALSGVTPVIGWLYPQTYANIPEAVLTRAAEYGTMVHKTIELVDYLSTEPVDAFALDYIRMREEHGCRTIRNEYLVTDYKHFASSIDVVMEDADGGCVLADIKTTSQLHRDNVRVQLSIYAYLFELVNPDQRVKRLVALWLPKPQYGRAEWVELERVPSDVCADILQAYLWGDDPTPWREAVGGTLPQQSQQTLPFDLKQVESEIVAIERKTKELKQQSDELRAGLLKVFQEYDVKKWDGQYTIILRKDESQRETFDTKAFAAAYPDLYSQFIKTSKVKPSITIKIKES